MNDFSMLDAQDEMSRLAQLSPEEMEEANAYYDEINAREDDIPPVVDPEAESLWQKQYAFLNELRDKDETGGFAELRKRDEALDAL